MTPYSRVHAAIVKAVPEIAKRQPPEMMPLPVKYDGISYYWGPQMEMVADFDEGVNDGEGFRIRGWGRIQNEEQQDACAYWIQDAINAYAEVRLEDVLRAIEATNVDCLVRVQTYGGDTHLYVGTTMPDQMSVVPYNLNRPLSDQPEETILFLEKILV